MELVDTERAYVKVIFIFNFISLWLPFAVGMPHLHLAAHICARCAHTHTVLLCGMFAFYTRILYAATKFNKNAEYDHEFSCPKR